MVPLSEGRFDLDDYIDYVISILAFPRRRHPRDRKSASLRSGAGRDRAMESVNDPYAPRSMVLMGGPIDTRSNPTAVNKLRRSAAPTGSAATSSPRCRSRHPGVMRDVYPGFLQLNGFVSMNLDRHLDAHKNLFFHLVKGDGDSVHKHKDFYDEYLAVMDLAAEYYLQTVETVFVRHALPRAR